MAAHCPATKRTAQLFWLRFMTHSFSRVRLFSAYTSTMSVGASTQISPTEVQMKVFIYSLTLLPCTAFFMHSSTP